MSTIRDFLGRVVGDLVIGNPSPMNAGVGEGVLDFMDRGAVGAADTLAAIQSGLGMSSARAEQFASGLRGIYNANNPDNPLTSNDSNNPDPVAPSRPRSVDDSGGSSRRRSSSPSAQSFHYMYADLAKQYAMRPETAYQEALENTRYSRAVEDMQRAGLNPASLFGAGRVSGAGTGVMPALWSNSSSGGGSGGSSNYSRRSSNSSSKSGNGGRLFSSSAYSVISAAAGIAGAALTKSAGGYWIGSSVAQGAMNALDALSRA